MNKEKFYENIRKKLNGFKKEEVDGIIEYYDELVNDKIESGLSEEEVISSFGDIDDMINEIKANLVMERSEKREANVLKNFLIILGVISSPILLPLAIVFSLVFFIILLVIVILLFSFSVSAIAVLLSVVLASIELIFTSREIGLTLILLGSGLIASSLLWFITIEIFRLGKYLLNAINKLFIQKLKKKKNKGEMQSV